MDNHELLMLERKLVKARDDLFKLFSSNIDFYLDLRKILDRYKSGYFERKRFEIKFSTLFRIITNRVRAKDLDISEYSEMDMFISVLEMKYPNEFLEFANIIKLHVNSRYSLGYNHMYRLIYLESVCDILESY